MSTQFVLQSAVNFPVALWLDIPATGYQSCLPLTTFKIHLYTEDDAPHTVHLYSQGSRSIPWQAPQNKWSHLNPQWRFTDLSGNVINDITLTNAASTLFNGTSGYLASAEFYYIDDMPTQTNCTSNAYVLIWAVVDFSQYPVQNDINENLQTAPGYVNSKVLSVAPYGVDQLIPDRLEITSDAINPLFNYYWINTSIPYIISVVGKTPDGLQEGIIRNSPISNQYGISAGPFIQSISTIPSSMLTWTPSNDNAYLSALDDQNFVIGGYLKGDVVSTQAAETVSIEVSGNVYFENIPPHYPYVWVSNPNNNTLNRIFAPCIRSRWTASEFPFELNQYDQKIVDVTNLQVTAMPTMMSLTGFNGIYGIAVDEFKYVWCTDAESDKVYKFSSEGILISSLNFGEGTTYGHGLTGGCTPAGISVNGLGDIWVTFFDSASTICLDPNTGNIKYIINPGDPWSAIPDMDPVFKPVLAEPDMNNDVWTTYNNSICSILVKYNSTGSSIITSITLPMCSNPMDLHITKDNDIWVSLNGYISAANELSYVNKYMGSTPFTLLSSITALGPSYLAIDNDNNLWFTQGENIVTRIVTTGEETNWVVGSAVSGENALEGICCDIYNHIHVINSVDNYLYGVAELGGVDAEMKILPDQNLGWYNDTGFVYTLTSEDFKSAQAFGDWSGSKWIRKYAPIYEPYIFRSMSGYSSSFDIYEFDKYDIRRFNESWDSADQIKTFARSPHIADNPVFWDGYMKTVWGDAAAKQGEAFGREAYEKISNFVANHADVNTCNVAQLYNLAQYTDVPIDDYGVSLPPELRRIMDIGSVNQQLLWGTRCKCNRNITNEYTTYLSGQQLVSTNYICKYCGHYHPGNKGDYFNPLTYSVTAFTPFIIEDRSNVNNKYQLITPPALLSSYSISTSSFITDNCDPLITNNNYITTYPLSSYYNIILPNIINFSLSANVSEFQQIITYFCFNNYVASTPCAEQTAGIINWDDQYTTLDERVSSIDDWYGSEQSLERMFNYVLHKGLGLVKD